MLNRRILRIKAFKELYAYAENPDEAELRLQFEQNDWHKGAQMYEQKPYKRTYTPSEATQQKLFEVETNPNKEEEV